MEQNTPLKPLLTPGQKHLLSLPNIQALISRFDLHPFSSPEAIINTKIHNQAQVLIASFSSSKPDIIDTDSFAPMSDSGAAAVKAFHRQVKIDKLPKGYCLDANDKPIFDRDFKAKGISEKELPPNHPDYVPF